MPRATRDTAGQFRFSTTGLSPSLVQHSTAWSNLSRPWWLSHYPLHRSGEFRLLPVRSSLLGESQLLSFPPVTKIFQFTGFPRARLWIQRAVLGVVPFGDLRIEACFQLPGVYRRSLRPSSSLCA